MCRTFPRTKSFIKLPDNANEQLVYILQNYLRLFDQLHVTFGVKQERPMMMDAVQYSL